MSSAVFSVEGLGKDFGRFTALDDLSFSMLSSDVMGMIGKNGAGKSTCFDIIAGLIRPSAGKVFYKGENITGSRPRDLFRMGIGFTFQKPALFTSMTVIENVQMAILSAEDRAGIMLSPFKPLYREDAIEVLEDFRLADIADVACGQLTYGDLKRLEVAVVMSCNPRLLFMDEPTAGMTPNERGAFMETCVEVALRNGTAVFFIEHDLDNVFHFAGRCLVLDHGRLIADGTPAEVRDDAKVRDIYLGYSFDQLEVANAQANRH